MFILTFCKLNDESFGIQSLLALCSNLNEVDEIVNGLQ